MTLLCEKAQQRRDVNRTSWRGCFTRKRRASGFVIQTYRRLRSRLPEAHRPDRPQSQPDCEECLTGQGFTAHRAALLEIIDRADYASIEERADGP